MNLRVTILAALAALGLSACTADGGAIVWTEDSHPQAVEICGAPQTIDTPLGKALRFDGEDDALFFAEVPVSGMDELTVELIFRQDPEAAFEQRFLHIGEVRGPRILFETRVKPGGVWYFDAHINFGAKERSATLIDSTLTHPAGQWAGLELVCSHDGMTSYVNGVEQLSTELPFENIINSGMTSIGVRQNRVCWFRGDIYKLRITPRALQPEDFLKDYEKLNK